MNTFSILQSLKTNATIETMEFNEIIPNSGLLLKMLAQQRLDSKYCDATLTVNRMQINVHQCVMAAVSSYFDNMFTNMKNSYFVDENGDPLDGGNSDLEINFKNPDVFLLIVDYVYTGKITITSNNVADVVDLATQFSISKLQDLCCKYLQENLNVKTCFHIQNLAKQHNLSSLVNTVDSFVISNIHQLIQYDAILEVSLPTLEIYLGRSVALSEIKRLDVICRWVEYKLSARKNYLPILLKLVFWPVLDDIMILEFLNEKKTLFIDEWLYFHVLMSLNNSDKLPAHLKDKFSELKNIYMKVHEPIKKQFIITANVKSEEVTENASVNDNISANDFGDEDYIDEDDIKREVEVEEKPVVNRRERTRLSLNVDKSNDNDEQLDSKFRKRKLNTSGNKENIEKLKKQKKHSNDILASNDITKKVKRKYCKSENLQKTECPECPFVTNYPEKMIRHMRVAHKDSKQTFNCDLCQFKCKWNRQFYRHLRNRHFPGPPYHCDTCGQSSTTIQSLLLHRMDHIDHRPYSCEICGATFKVKYILETHMKFHTGQKLYKCTECDKSFATKGTLKQHIGVHSNLRPYLCDLCGFSTKYQSHLKSHSRLHSGEVYPCQYPNCNYKTPKRSQLACHQKYHFGIRGHTCSTCGRSFIERSHLVRHEKIHLGVRPFACEKCNYASTRRDKLKEHYEKHHNENLDSIEGVTLNKRAYRPRRSYILSSQKGGTAAKKSTQSGEKVVKRRSKKFIDVGNDSMVNSIVKVEKDFSNKKPRVLKNKKEFKLDEFIEQFIIQNNPIEKGTGIQITNNLDLNKDTYSSNDPLPSQISGSSTTSNVVNQSLEKPFYNNSQIIENKSALQSSSNVLSTFDKFINNSSVVITNTTNMSIRPVEIDPNIDNALKSEVLENQLSMSNKKILADITSIDKKRIITDKISKNFKSFSSSHYSSSSGVSNDPTGTSGVSDITATTTNLMISPSTKDLSSPGTVSQNLELSPDLNKSKFPEAEIIVPSTIRLATNNQEIDKSRETDLTTFDDISKSILNLYSDGYDNDEDGDNGITVIYVSDNEDKYPLLKIRNDASDNESSSSNKAVSASFEAKLEKLKKRKLVKERIKNLLKVKSDANASKNAISVGISLSKSETEDLISAKSQSSGVSNQTPVPTLGIKAVGEISKISNSFPKNPLTNIRVIGINKSNNSPIVRASGVSDHKITNLPKDPKSVILFKK